MTSDIYKPTNIWCIKRELYYLTPHSWYYQMLNFSLISTKYKNPSLFLIISLTNNNTIYHFDTSFLDELFNLLIFELYTKDFDLKYPFGTWKTGIMSVRSQIEFHRLVSLFSLSFFLVAGRPSELPSEVLLLVIWVEVDICDCELEIWLFWRRHLGLYKQ